MKFDDLLSGTIKAFSFRIIGILVSYIFMFLVVRQYKTETWGTLILCLSVLNIGALFGKHGMDTALLKLTSENLKLNKISSIQKYFKLAIRSSLIASIIVAIIIYILAGNIATQFFLKPHLEPFVKLFAVGIPFFSILGISNQSIRGLKKIGTFTFFRNGLIFCLALLGLGVLWFLNGPKEWLYTIYIVSMAVAAGISVFYFRKLLNKTPSHNKALSEVIDKKRLYDLALPLMMASSMFLIMQWIDIFMLGRFTTEQDVGVYNIAFKISTITSISLFAVNAISAPKFAELSPIYQMDQIAKVAKDSAKLVFLLSAPAVALLIIFPGTWMRIFGEYSDAGKNVLIVLAISQFISAISGSVGNIMQMTGKEKQFQNIVLVAGIVNIILNFILIPKMGITGAAIASLVSMAGWNFGCLIFIYRKYHFWAGFGGYIFK